MNLEIWWSKKTFLLFLAKCQGCLFFLKNVLLSCFLERRNVHSTSHSYGSLTVLCNFPKHMLLLKCLHDGRVLFFCLCSKPSIAVITSHFQTNINFNFRVKDILKSHAPCSQVYFVFISSHPLRPTPSHFHPRPSSLSFLYTLMGFMVAVPLPSVSQSIWPHFLPVGPPPRAKTHLRKHRTSRSSAVVTPFRLWTSRHRRRFAKKSLAINVTL